MKLTHVRLLVTDFPACFRFYRDVMGFAATWGDENSGYASFVAGEVATLALFDRQAQAQAIGAASLPLEAASQDKAMLIFEVEDLAKSIAALQARGANFVQGIQDHPEWGMRCAYLRDPNGTLIELNSPLPKDAWTPELRQENDKYSRSYSS